MLTRFADVLVAAFLGAGLGVQVFLSFLVAPLAFQLILDRALAVRVVTALFPGYYLFGLAATGVALLLTLALAIAERRSAARWATVSLLALTLAGTVYAARVLLPRTQAVRLRAEAARAGDPAPLEFRRLHRWAATVNIAVFAVGLVALTAHAAARPR
ncbi:MAG: DUF4149 domain-containing protein [Candidatus Rokuibacteriota bacterium]